MIRFIPMDGMVWTFSLVSIVAVGVTLVMMNKTKDKKMGADKLYRGNCVVCGSFQNFMPARGHPQKGFRNFTRFFPHFWGRIRAQIHRFLKKEVQLLCAPPISAITLSYTSLIDENIPNSWISNALSQRLLLGIWFLVGFVIGSAYKGSLFASLIKIRYERPINTIQGNKYNITVESAYNEHLCAGPICSVYPDFRRKSKFHYKTGPVRFLFLTLFIIISGCSDLTSVQYKRILQYFTFACPYEFRSYFFAVFRTSLTLAVP